MEKLLVVVKTYPHPSAAYQELVCTAAMRADGSFVRLYPVDFRYRPPHQLFSKYQWIELDMVKNKKDNRPESYRPILESICLLGEPLPPDKCWEARKEVVLKHPIKAMCQLREEHKIEGTSLGVVRPTRVNGISVRFDSYEWDERHLSALTQYSLFDQQKKVLQKIPYKFSYDFLCDAPSCSGHSMTITDWELGMLYLNCLRRHGDEETAKRLVIEKYMDEICSSKNDTHFFVGTTYPYNSWIVLGAFYPRLSTESNAMPQTTLSLDF